uniref:Uncharacterized protein n=1 Tax=Ciona intestinalis TaxID=7719 RepID=H2XKQ3_CIOIN
AAYLILVGTIHIVSHDFKVFLNPWLTTSKCSQINKKTPDVNKITKYIDWLYN